jgi:hypothetical protein
METWEDEGDIEWNTTSALAWGQACS